MKIDRTYLLMWFVMVFIVNFMLFVTVVMVGKLGWLMFANFVMCELLGAGLLQHLLNGWKR